MSDETKDWLVKNLFTQQEANAFMNMWSNAVLSRPVFTREQINTMSDFPDLRIEYNDGVWCIEHLFDHAPDGTVKAVILDDVPALHLIDRANPTLPDCVKGDVYIEYRDSGDTPLLNAYANITAPDHCEPATDIPAFSVRSVHNEPVTNAYVAGPFGHGTNMYSDPIIQSSDFAPLIFNRGTTTSEAVRSILAAEYAHIECLAQLNNNPTREIAGHIAALQLGLSFGNSLAADEIARYVDPINAILADSDNVDLFDLFGIPDTAENVSVEYSEQTRSLITTFTSSVTRTVGTYTIDTQRTPPSDET